MIAEKKCIISNIAGSLCIFCEMWWTLKGKANFELPLTRQGTWRYLFGWIYFFTLSIKIIKANLMYKIILIQSIANRLLFSNKFYGELLYHTAMIALFHFTGLSIMMLWSVLQVRYHLYHSLQVTNIEIKALEPYLKGFRVSKWIYHLTTISKTWISQNLLLGWI